ncbi:dammarenediol II synthase-like protein [Tanacetum coccineum]
MLQEMYKTWPFFRVTKDLIEMVFAKGDPDIAALNDKLLISEDLWSFGEALRANYEETKNLVLKSLQMTCWWADNPNGDEFRYHLAKVPDYLWIGEDGITMKCFGSQAWDWSEKIHQEISLIRVDSSLKSPISGGFAVWEPPIPKPFLQLLNPSEIFADIVVEKEHVETTSSCIQVLVEFNRLHPRHRMKEILLSISNGIRYLEETQWHDGSWYGYWGVCFIYGTFFALRGLSSTGKTYDNSEAVCKGVKFLLSVQNEEGGWGESRMSCPTEVYTPLDGNRTICANNSWAMPVSVLTISLFVSGQNIFPLWALGEYRKLVWQCHKNYADTS